MKKFVAILCLSLMLTSCAAQRGLVSSGYRPGEDGTHHFFLWGIFQEEEVNPARVCRSASNVAYVESQQSGLDVVLTLLTVGLYSPRSYAVYCRS